MRPIEADWIREALLAIGPDAASPVANVGSSTGEFRSVRKPHIEARLFAPLRDAGFEFVHIDMKAAEGVDLVGDLTDPAFLDRVRQTGCRSVICSNLLEHLAHRDDLLRACEALVAEDGVMVLTVPYSYPYHPDPIDTMYRPSPAELARALPNLEMTRSEILSDGTLIDEVHRANNAAGFLYWPKAALRSLRFWRPREALAQLHRLTWSVRSFKVTCAVFGRTRPATA
jgi:SAM-dependent methyltransferase